MMTMRSYAPRGVLALGGVLAAVSTVLPWIRLPVLGASSLWGLRGLLATLAGLTGEISTLAPRGLLLLALGVLVLGVGTIACAVTATRGQRLQRGILLSGSLTAILGVAAVVQALLMTADGGSLSVGPIVLLAGGLLSLAAYPLATSGTDGHERWGMVPSAVSAAVAGAGFLAAAVGLVFLFWANAAVDGDSTSSEPETEQSQQQESTPAPDRENSTTDEQGPGDGDEDDSTINSAKGDVVDEFYRDLDSDEYQDAWGRGGKNLSPSFDEFTAGYADDLTHEWHTDDVEGDTVHGTLTVTKNNGSEQTYTAWYKVTHDEIVDGDATPTS